jgi:hypothetical protein
MVSHNADENKIIGKAIQKLKYHVDIRNHPANVESHHSTNDKGNNIGYQYCIRRASMREQSNKRTYLI